MKVGDLVRHHRPGGEYFGKMGIVTAILKPHEHNLWPEDNLVEILYSNSQTLTWNERSIKEIGDESR